MRLKTYIINLEKSTIRKQYMQELLKPYTFLDVEFIKAIDGRLLSEEERKTLFDYQKSRKLYGRVLNEGEVGCALSHRKVYEELLRGKDLYALVLEDDVAIQRDLNSLDLSKVDKVLNSTKPRVLMMSGDYCYYRKRPIIKTVFALGAYAYIINKAAARLILEKTRACCVADDWVYYRRIGLRLFAVYPYMIDANLNMELLSSDVKQDTWGINRSQMPFKENLFRAITGITLKFFKRIDHFEYKIFIYQNTIYPIKLKRRV